MTVSFDIEQGGTDPESAFTIAREDAKWNWGITQRRNGNAQNVIDMKTAFMIANKPKGVSADHFIRWVKEAVLDPESPKIPVQHQESVLAAAREYSNPEGKAVAIPCSYTEASGYLELKGRELKKGVRRPKVYRFIGTVSA